MLEVGAAHLEAHEIRHFPAEREVHSSHPEP